MANVVFIVGLVLPLRSDINAIITIFCTSYLYNRNYIKAVIVIFLLDYATLGERKTKLSKEKDLYQARYFHLSLDYFTFLLDLLILSSETDFKQIYLLGYLTWRRGTGIKADIAISAGLLYQDVELI